MQSAWPLQKIDRIGGFTPLGHSCRNTVMGDKNEKNTEPDARGEVTALLSLMGIGGVGYWTLRKIYTKHGSCKALLKLCTTGSELRVELKELGANPEIDPALNGRYIDQLWTNGIDWYRYFWSLGIKILVHDDPEFPESLKTIPEPPYWLFAQGNMLHLNSPTVAIVGTRKPSSEGRFLAEYISRIMHSFDVVMASGLAKGVDQIAHQNTLDLGIPNIGVMGTGIEHTYPPNAVELRTAILQLGGVILSEYLPTQNYSAETFVRRNRLQAALSKVVIPIDWASKSGTAHTVRFAHEYGKRLIFPLTPLQARQNKEVYDLAKQYSAEIVVVPGDETKILSILSAEFSESGETAAHVKKMRNLTMHDQHQLFIKDDDEQT